MPWQPLHCDLPCSLAGEAEAAALKLGPQATGAVQAAREAAAALQGRRAEVTPSDLHAVAQGCLTAWRAQQRGLTEFQVGTAAGTSFLGRNA